jgi:hypothetical protein
MPSTPRAASYRGVPGRAGKWAMAMTGLDTPNIFCSRPDMGNSLLRRQALVFLSISLFLADWFLIYNNILLVNTKRKRRNRSYIRLLSGG